MTDLIVRRCQVADIEAAVDLIRAYEGECGMAEFGSYRPDWEQYKTMERSGWYTAIGAFRGNRMVGMLTVLAGPNPHVGAVMASTESFFVLPEERNGGTGLKLLAQAEALAKEKGARGLIVSARADSRLSRVMRLMKGYKPSNEVFCKVLT